MDLWFVKNFGIINIWSRNFYWLLSGVQTGFRRFLLKIGNLLWKNVTLCLIRSIVHLIVLLAFVTHDNFSHLSILSKTYWWCQLLSNSGNLFVHLIKWPSHQEFSLDNKYKELRSYQVFRRSVFPKSWSSEIPFYEIMPPLIVNFKISVNFKIHRISNQSFVVS